MALHPDDAIAFERPGGKACTPSRARPVDLVHLARQTMGDRALEQQVLDMFVHQVLVARERIGGADLAERGRMAHAIKGSARGVGAFAVADCAAAIEDAPDDKALHVRLSNLVDEVRDFVSAINR